MKKRLRVMTLLCVLGALLAFVSGCNVDEGSTYYTVSFDSNGGSFVPSQSVEGGKTAVEPKSPTRTNYAFVAWNKGGSAFDFSSPITADTILTAQWKSASTSGNADSKNADGKTDDESVNNDGNNDSDGKTDDESVNNDDNNDSGGGGTGQVITVTAERLSSLSLSDSSYGDTYTLKLSGEWTNDDIVTLGTKVKAISGKKISVDMTEAIGITEIGNSAFRGAQSLVSVQFPNTLESIGWCAFEHCTALTSIEIPASVTKVNTCIFQNCTALESVTFLDCTFSINSWDFKGCTALTTVDFGNNITFIGHEAFADCTSLTSIKIPESIGGLSDYSFKNCTALTTVQFDSSKTRTQTTSFDGCTALTNKIVLKNYTVYFEANCGEGTRKDQTFRVDVEKALSENDFTRDGFVFVGWNTESDGTGKAYADCAVVKNLVTEDWSHIWLYAQWLEADVAGESYTVQFDANGGTGRGFSQTFWTDIAQALSANCFTQSGFTFVGWNTRSDGSGFSYGDGSFVKNLASAGETTTLYAQWERDESVPATYTVTFDKNGGEGSMASQTFFVGREQALSCNTFTHNNEKYAFERWNTRADGTGITYADGAPVKDLATTEGTNVTLYAQWIDTTETYTIVFDKNGGEGSMGAQNCTVDNFNRLTENAFTRAGYQFRQWNTQADGSGDSYSNGEEIYRSSEVANTTVTLYAQWTAYTYYISFDRNGGNSSMPYLTCTVGTSETLPKSTFTRTNYAFAGWNTAADGSGTPYADGASVLNLTLERSETVTLYAQWIATYYVKFNSNGGSGTMSTQICTIDTEQALPANVFTRTNYAFTGWNTAADGTGTAYTDGVTVLNLTREAGKTITLYAQWRATAYYVEFNKNYLEYYSSVTMSKILCTIDTEQALPANVFTRTNYAFTGWNTAADGTGTAYDDGASVLNLTLVGGTVTLYAQWSNIYYVEFNANGGTGSMKTQSLVYSTATQALSLNAFTRSGYAFAGWNTSADGSGTRYANGARTL